MNTTYVIEKSASLGRYLCASRDIKQGEIIIQSKPEVIGAQINAFPICFRCSIRLNPSNKLITCEKCKTAPLCAQFCNGEWHNDNECISLEKMKIPRGFLIENPLCVMPLRVYLLKTSDKKLWDQIMKMESHVKERKDTYIWKFHKKNVENILSPYLPLNCEKDAIIGEICGILDVNTFEVRPCTWSSTPEDCLRGLYLKPALMAHDCLSNTHISVDEEYTMTIRASCNIAKGRMITFNYTHELQGTIDRQIHLKVGKHFACTCKRCTDPTELGTHLSSLHCPRCHLGFVQITNEKYTACFSCNAKISCDMLRTTLNVCRDEIQTRWMCIEDLTGLKSKLLKTLHKNHYCIWEINQNIISLLAKNQDEQSLITRHDLCVEFLEILKILEPGLSRHRGITLYELYKTKTLLDKIKHTKGNLSLQDYYSMKKDTEVVLKSSIGHLVYEPKSTPEGMLTKRALNDLQVLRDTMKDIEKLLQKRKSQ